MPCAAKRSGAKLPRRRMPATSTAFAAGIRPCQKNGVRKMIDDEINEQDAALFSIRFLLTEAELTQCGPATNPAIRTLVSTTILTRSFGRHPRRCRRVCFELAEEVCGAFGRTHPSRAAVAPPGGRIRFPSSPGPARSAKRFGAGQAED
jgi:hypothetical protein